MVAESPTLQQLRETFKTLSAEWVTACENNAKTVAEGKELSDAEQGNEAGLEVRVTNLKTQIEKLANASGSISLGDQPGDEIPVSPKVPAQAKTVDDRGLFNYRSSHEWLIDVHAAGDERDLSRLSEKLRTHQIHMLNAVGSDEQSVGSLPFGGFLAPHEFSERLLGPHDIPADPFEGRMMSVPVGAQSITLTAITDTTHATSVSGGMRVYWGAETVAPASSRFATEQVKLEPQELNGLAFATEKLISLSPQSIPAIINAGFQREFRAEKWDAKINGTGAGQPEGVLNSPAALSLTRAAAGNNIDGADLIAMSARAYMFDENPYIWLFNPDAKSDLVAAHTAGTNSDRFHMTFGNGADLGPTLMGKPMFFHEFIPSVAAAGSAILVDPSQYLWGPSTAPNMMGSAESIHVRFSNRERAFLVWENVDGRCWWRSPLTPRQGSNTLSPIVTLAAA